MVPMKGCAHPRRALHTHGGHGTPATRHLPSSGDTEPRVSRSHSHRDTPHGSGDTAQGHEHRGENTQGTQSHTRQGTHYTQGTCDTHSHTRTKRHTEDTRHSPTGTQPGHTRTATDPHSQCHGVTHSHTTLAHSHREGTLRTAPSAHTVSPRGHTECHAHKHPHSRPLPSRAPPLAQPRPSAATSAAALPPPPPPQTFPRRRREPAGSRSQRRQRPGLAQLPALTCARSHSATTGTGPAALPGAPPPARAARARPP